MAATNKTTWLRNLGGASEPLIMRVLFASGATAAVKQGEILELEGGNWSPLDSDQAMAGIIAVANEEIKSGDLAGYYEIIIPRPDDVFEFALAAAGATAVGTALYWSDSQTLTVSVGTNIVGYAIGQSHYPKKQQHLADGQIGDMGTTIASWAKVEMTFKLAVSYYVALIK